MLLEQGWGKPAQAVLTAQAEEGLSWERLLEMVQGVGEEPEDGAGPGIAPAAERVVICSLDDSTYHKPRGNKPWVTGVYWYVGYPPV